MLEEDITIGGEALADLWVSTSATDADWVVKIIDVFPPDAEDHDYVRDGKRMSNYDMMVRSEVIRGRFRNSYENPEPFIPNKITEVNLPLQDICHTFKPGHRIMVHVQSTWFPLIDRNPQKYVENIFKAKAEDFIVATHKVFHKPEASSWIEFKILGQ